ncbi:hypothetical protein [Sorangium sp. So ce131]|uniref:hypothetical protein n=1 Tax=Sorangium sp. So ce131 TaxID=3133282 RepID=UPI003F64405B
MRWMISMLMSSVLIACSDVPPRLPVDGSGGAGGSGAGGDDRPDGDLVTMSIVPSGGCVPSSVTPGPDELGAIALGRFEVQAPLRVEELRYVACSGIAHEVVYFRSGSEVPDEEPEAVWSIAVPESSMAERQVAISLDPPLRLTDDQRFGYFGVRMTGEGDVTMCVAACEDSAQPERNYWSDNDAPPFGWKQLSQSPTPAAGLPYDYQFSIAGHPL